MNQIACSETTSEQLDLDPVAFMRDFYVGLDLGKERDPLGTPYPRTVEHVRQIVAHPELSGNCALSLDATGVGGPVVDMFRAAHLGCDLAAVNITGGDRQTRSGSTWNVPKQNLLASLQILMDHNELKLAARMKEIGPLIRELTDFRCIRRNNDLVIALACWRAQRPTNTHGNHRIV